MSGDWYAPNQQAVRADASGPAESGEGGGSAPPPANPLDTMTKAELIAHAEGLGLDVDDTMTKAQIREAIGA